ncbi:MAG TPA: nucleotidyltransferase family protein [Actinomycetota bacterium]|nr:nucleotidyltransferase family protein [Actinomycetota bacterium]
MSVDPTVAPSPAAPSRPLAVASAEAASAPLALIAELCGALEAAGVRSCHWKSNEALGRSASGDNDLDLLVHRSDAATFEEVLARLGFKEAHLPPWKRLPGIWHAYALDRASGRLVHVHAHHQLVVGDDMTKNYHLPIEDPYLASAVPAPPFHVPSPEFELALLVLRMVIKHDPWDAIASGQGSLSASERRELEDLLARVDPGDAARTLHRHLPIVTPELWARCLRSLRPGASVGFRIRTAGELQRALAVCARRGRALDTYLKVWRRGRIVVRRRVLRRRAEPKRLGRAGLLVAIVGGDGAGKSTVVEDLTEWLGKDFRTLSVHLGKPPRSALSDVVKGAMTLAASVKRSPTPSGRALRASVAADGGASMTPRTAVRLAWEVLTARDRYRAYRHARRAASNGAIVVCDRFPLAQVRQMDGPVSVGLRESARRARLVGLLSEREQRYYARIAQPDILVVLRVDPDVAVERRREAPEEVLRQRSEEIWAIDWSTTPAIVIDAGRPKDEVLARVRAEVWSRLS